MHSEYRGKLLEELILGRLDYTTRESVLSDRQYTLWKLRSMEDAIQEVVNIAKRGKKENSKRKGFCALVALGHL